MRPDLDLIEDHLARRPGMEPRDIYKLLYQGIRGPEHLISSQVDFTQRLSAEWESIDLEDSDPIREVIRADGNILRLNLRPYKANGGQLEELIAACLETSRRSWGAQADLLSTWYGLVSICKEGYLAKLVFEEMSSFTSWLEQNHFPAVHHSEQYRSLYRPSYRLVAAEFSLKA